jgi:hypothetical protein
MNDQASFIVLKDLYGNAPTLLSPLQEFLSRHLDLLTNAWISAWIVTGAVLIWIYVRGYRDRKE